MPNNTPDQQITLPIGVDTADNPVAFTNFVADVEPKLVRTYTDLADRTARMLVVAENELSGLATENRVEVYDGTNHISLYPRSMFSYTRVAADQLLTMSSTALQNVTALVAALPTAGTFGFRGVVFYDSSTAADIKFAFTMPGGATMRWGAIGLGTAVTTNTGDVTNQTQVVSGTATAFAGIGVNTIIYVTFEGEISMGGTAGNLQLQAAQNTSDATQSTIRARSRMEVWRSL